MLTGLSEILIHNEQSTTLLLGASMVPS